MKGLGAVSRESGHSRVPAPPERMTGTIGRVMKRHLGSVGKVDSSRLKSRAFTPLHITGR